MLDFNTIEQFDKIATPFYYYDMDLLHKTVDHVAELAEKYDIKVHYAVKANVERRVLEYISSKGFGADCVSGNEVLHAHSCGFPADKIVYAGVGKTDREIHDALTLGIEAFNCESLQEIYVINEMAHRYGIKASISVRINPDIDAHTHKYVTTGLYENKFGISQHEFEKLIEIIQKSEYIDFFGLHFHIGSQILEMNDFVALCNRVNELQERLMKRHIICEHINVGGGLGVDYHHPNHFPVPNLAEYFAVYHKHLRLYPGQTLHFELGRAVVAQCGSLISRVTYVKKGTNKQFAILDAGFPDLIRPALYQAYHRIENLTSDEAEETYDVVGPICESSDVFLKAVDLNKAHRGDLFALRSAGAYGEIMASGYNCRELPKGYTSEELV